MLLALFKWAITQFVYLCQSSLKISILTFWRLIFVVRRATSLCAYLGFLYNVIAMIDSINMVWLFLVVIILVGYKIENLAE